MKNSLQHERQIVRSLVEKVAEYSSETENQRIIQRWKDVNALRKPDRAPVWCRPVGCWKELLPQEILQCKNPWLRSLEYKFRQLLIKRYIGDDEPIMPYFEVNAVFDAKPSNIWGVEVGKHKSTSDGGAWAYDPPLKIETDFDKLILPKYIYNKVATARLMEQTNELLGDIMEVRLQYGPDFDSATMGTAAADLRGLEQIMMDMIAEPKLMHRLASYLLEAQQTKLDMWEKSGMITPNNNMPMLLSDPVGQRRADGTYTLSNCWCAANSQEFDQVSPAMWEEFCLNYQKKILKRFGYVCYGCCENLAKKIDGVLSIPNLRILVCSAWTGLDAVLERVNKDYCIMWRQKASDVVFPDNIKKVRQDLEEGFKKLKGQYFQVVLRELQTLCGHQDRLHAWTAIAKELAAKYS
ncbi:MAG: hypothetical protein A2Y10_10515 [Planctomycetes bacterium GWF2_41_51]|nr:MAG: hypothetical protein A2Y10_10515 [Planctomycetes bacterium GWF2_41_51]HBG26908.1 hypothetical protein [Phycisphaerales bacterium]